MTSLNQISLAKKIWLFAGSMAFIVMGAVLAYKGVHHLFYLWSSVRARVEIIYLESGIFTMLLLGPSFIPLCLAAIIKILWNPSIIQIHGAAFARVVAIWGIFSLFAGPVGYFMIKERLKDEGYHFCGFTDHSRHSSTSAWAYGDKLKCPYNEILTLRN